MKRMLSLAFCLGLALTQVVHAEDKGKNKQAKRQAKQAAVAQRNVSKAYKQNAKVQQRNLQPQRNVRAQRNLQVQQNLNAQRLQRQQGKIKHQNDAGVNAELRGRQFNRQQRAIVRNQNNRVITENNRVINRNNVVIRNRNSWYDASRRFNWRERHDRNWWRHHHGNTRFVLFGGGYYFWDNNYWYPAYGYDPAYSTYVYDEPIYGYNQYEPGRVISNVQAELQREGYYYGAIDGLIGPMTRSALARYQADHGLYVTRAIDEPTLQSLGLS